MGRNHEYFIETGGILNIFRNIALKDVIIKITLTKRILNLIRLYEC